MNKWTGIECTTEQYGVNQKMVEDPRILIEETASTLKGLKCGQLLRKEIGKMGHRVMMLAMGADFMDLGPFAADGALFEFVFFPLMEH